MQGWGTWRTREVLGASGDRLGGQTSRVVPAQGSAAMAGLCWQGTPGGATAGSGNAGTMPGPRSGLTPRQCCTPAWGFHHQIRLRRRCQARTVPAPARPGSSPAMMRAASAASWPVILPRRALMALMRNSVVSLVGGSWAPSSPCPESLRGWGKGTRGTPSSVWGSPGSSMVPQRRSLGFAGATTFEEGDGGWHDVSVGRLRWAVQRATEPRAIALVGAGEAISTA